MSEIDEFIKWLESKDLFICNVSGPRIGLPPTFWPCDTEGLSQRFEAAKATT